MIAEIHATAWVAPGARLGAGNVIGPYAVIEDDVVIGADNHIHAHAVIKAGTRLGDGNRIHEHAVIGGVPQDLGFKGHPSTVEIGNRNIIREAVTVHRSSLPDGRTVLGDDNFLMAGAHVAHDCRLGNRVIVAPYVGLGGHVQVGDRAFVSGGVMVHQFARIGRFAMVGGNSKVTQDVLPFFITDGVPARVRGLNLVGLRRAGFSPQDIRSLKEAYRTLFRSGLSLEQILAELGASACPHAAYLAEFISQSRRGFHRDKPD